LNVLSQAIRPKRKIERLSICLFREEEEREGEGLGCGKIERWRKGGRGTVGDWRIDLAEEGKARCRLLLLLLLLPRCERV